MAKSKCYLCHKVLKGGDGMLRQFPDGSIHKICKDTRSCYVRKRQQALAVKEWEGPHDEAKALEENAWQASDESEDEDIFDKHFYIAMGGGFVLLLALLVLIALNSYLE